jgi:hypothetical protein
MAKKPKQVFAIPPSAIIMDLQQFAALAERQFRQGILDFNEFVANLKSGLDVALRSVSPQGVRAYAKRGSVGEPHCR